MNFFRDDRSAPAEPDTVANRDGSPVGANTDAGSGWLDAQPKEVGQLTDGPVEDALAQVEAVSPAAAAATADALAGVGSAVAISHFNRGDNTAVKIVNYLQESLERFEADEEYLAMILRLFAPPEDFDARVEEWLDAHLLVIALDQDRGRFITAHALLATIHRRRGITVGALSFGGGSTFPVRRLPARRDLAYVVEVPAEEAEFGLHSAFGSSLNALQERLRDQSCWMVMLMSVEQWNRAKAQVPDAVVISDGKVKPMDIAVRALHASCTPIPAERWLADERVQGLIRDQTPAEVQEIVELIVAAQEMPESALKDGSAERASGNKGTELAAGDNELFVKRVDIVVGARLNWRKRLLAWHREHGRTGVEQNFLISAAVQKGTPVAHVYTGATALAAALGGDPGSVSLTGQDVPGVIDLVDAVEADLSADDTVVFKRVGWDDAALQYFWIDRPLSRKLFLDWLAERAVQSHTYDALESLTESQRRALAARIARLAVDWAVRQGRAQPLTRLAEKWYDHEVVWAEFIDVLDHASVQPSTARSIHPMLLVWANAAPTSRQPRKLAVAGICSRQFGRKYTGKALIRLKHAANSDDVRVIGAVRAAVRWLWEDETVRHGLFAAVVGWCADDKTAAAGRESFHTLASAAHPANERRPWLLVEQQEIDAPAHAVEDLAVGWRSLLAPGTGDDYLEDALPFWLEAAVEFATERSRIVDVLCRAVRGPEVAGLESPRNRLTGLVRQWSKQVPDDVRRKQLYNEVSGQVDDDFVARRVASPERSA